MATVRRAVSRGDAVLAYQPVVQADRTETPAFHEGLIRIIDETGRIVPLRDFMPLAETTELGRQIDCLSLSLGLQGAGRGTLDAAVDQHVGALDRLSGMAANPARRHRRG
jgi:EAL domain-containing protein (putative c-di-GMP-specific phosphodiesterase class I)